MGTNIRGKPTTPARRVWRISESAPMGEWVVLKPEPVVRQPREDLPDVHSGSWVTSSYDLLSGSEVIEGTDTVPGDLLDELFPPRQDDPKSPQE
jgi:hypothetical protein